MADEIDRGDYAPGWDEIPDQESSFDLRNNAEARKPWVVLLEFFRNGSKPPDIFPCTFGQLTNYKKSKKRTPSEQDFSSTSLVLKLM